MFIAQGTYFMEGCGIYVCESTQKIRQIDEHIKDTTNAVIDSQNGFVP